jgi:acetyltransferase-like isoleucine patch superfamily enzyme
MSFGKKMTKVFRKIGISFSKLRGYLLFGSTRLIDKGVIFENIEDIHIGRNSYIGAWCVLKTRKKIEIGENCSIHEGGFLSGNIKIGNGVRIANKVSIHTFEHSTKKEIPIYKQPIIEGKVEIEDDVWIGAQVIILKDVRIGKGSVIGAGSLVNKDIPPYSIAVGVPAKVIGNRT